MPQLELRLGVTAVALLYRLAKGRGGLFQVAAPGERDAEIMRGDTRLGGVTAVFEMLNTFDAHSAHHSRNRQDEHIEEQEA